MIDLTDRVIQTPRQPVTTLRWHAPRRVGQLLCGALLIALPLTNGLRLDLRRNEFYFAWHKMAAHDLFLLFWVSMLGVALLSAVSFLYGRLWCGWVCPQTLVSDFADSLKTRIDKAFRTRPGQPRFLLSRAVWTGSILAVSLGTGVILTCYWLAPPAVFRAAAAPWTDLPAALTVYGLAALLAGDMLWLRRRFCSHACPYGALMGTLADQNTLAVRYLSEREEDCIGCHKCETDCPMGIDIKQGVGQHACIGCGECIDSCNDVLGRRGKPGLIEFRYGLEPERSTQALTPAQRLGLWDARRMTLLASVPFCLAVLLFLMYGFLPLGASVNASGAIRRTPTEVRNTYALTVSNGQPRAAQFILSVRDLPFGRVEPAAFPMDAHASRTLPITLIGPANAQKLGRTPVHLRVSDGRGHVEIATVFYTPVP